MITYKEFDCDIKELALKYAKTQERDEEMKRVLDENFEAKKEIETMNDVEFFNFIQGALNNKMKAKNIQFSPRPYGNYSLTFLMPYANRNVSMAAEFRNYGKSLLENRLNSMFICEMGSKSIYNLTEIANMNKVRDCLNKAREELLERRWQDKNNGVLKPMSYYLPQNNQEC